MSELTIDRRQAVRAAAGVAAGSVLVAGAGVGSATANGRHDSRDNRHDHDSDFYGSWLVTHRNNAPAPPEVGKSIISLAAGGVLVSNDIDPVGGVASGTWDSRGHNRLVATFWGGFPAEGKDPAGTYRVQVSGRRQGSTMSGTFVLTIYPKGRKSQTITGTFTGTKIPAA
jgi:hypothetical protein